MGEETEKRRPQGAAGPDAEGHAVPAGDSVRSNSGYAPLTGESTPAAQAAGAGAASAEPAAAPIVVRSGVPFASGDSSVSETGVAPAESKPRPNNPEAQQQTVLIDTAPSWARRPRDLVSAALSLIAIILVMLLGIYARNTTVAVTSDAAKATSTLLETVVFVPFTVIEGLITFFLPVVVVGEAIWKRRWRMIATMGGAVVASVAVSYLLLWIFTKYFPASPLTGELAESLEMRSITLLPYVSVLSALLAVSGGHKRSRVVSFGWPLLFFVVILSVLQGSQSLEGAVITLLIGVMFGELARYLIGADPERALGADIVRLTRRASIDAKEIVRIDADANLGELWAWRITSTAPLGYGDSAGRETLRAVFEDRAGNLNLTGISAEQITEVLENRDEHTVTRAHGIHAARRAVKVRRLYHPPHSVKASRNYVIIARDGTAYHGAVLDADKQIVGILAMTWDHIRFEGKTRRPERTIDEAVERMALMEMAAQSEGFAPQREVRVSHWDDSCMMATRITDAMPVADERIAQGDAGAAGPARPAAGSATRPAAGPAGSAAASEGAERGGLVSDEALDDFWSMLAAAHRKGMCHGNISAECVSLREGRLELTNWEFGSLAANELSRRTDMAQAVAMMTVGVGAERAVASARRCLSPDLVISMAPMIQRAILPPETIRGLGGKKTIQQLRDLLVGTFGEDVEIEPTQLHRFSPKTVFTAVIGIVAVYLLLGSINFADLKETVSHAKPAWLLVAFASSMLTYLGAGMMLKNFTAEKISLKESTFVQLAASVVSLVAPAGIGHAALNLRYLQKQKVATPVAIATVSMVQLFQFGTTVLFLVVLALMTGDVGQLTIPSSSILVAIGLLVVLIVAVMLVRPVRAWIVEKLRPYAEQVWPRLVWLGTHPERIAWGFASALVLTLGYVATFAASLFAFDYSLPIVTLAITYLVSNSVGSVVPSPGGIGPVEAALTGGLTLAGVPYSIAFSAAIVYRVLTFWAPVPIGWVCLQYLQKKGIV